MSEPELVFESDLEGWIRFKYSDLRGKMFPEKKEEFLCTAWFYGYLCVCTIQNTWKLWSQIRYRSLVQKANSHLSNSFIKLIQTLFLL